MHSISNRLTSCRTRNPPWALWSKLGLAQARHLRASPILISCFLERRRQVYRSLAESSILLVELDRAISHSQIGQTDA